MRKQCIVRLALLLAAVCAIAPVASALQDDMTFTVNNRAIEGANTATTTAGLTWHGYMVPGNGRRLYTKDAANGTRLEFQTNAAGQTHAGSYLYTTFAATPVANFGSIKIQLDVTSPATLRFLISSGADWYISSTKTFSADNTYLFNIDPDLTWALITDAALAADLEQVDGGDNLPMQDPASLTYGALPAAFSADGGGVYIESAGDNENRPYVQLMAWDVAATLVEVPQTRGMTVTDATTALTNALFTVANSTATPADWLIPVGNVQTTTPGATQNAVQGSEVLLNIVAALPNAWLWNGGAGNLLDEAMYTAVGLAPPVSPIDPTNDSHGLRLRAGTVSALGVIANVDAIWVEGNSTLTIGQDAVVTTDRFVDVGVQQMGDAVGILNLVGNGSLTNTTDTTIGQNNVNDAIAGANLGVNAGHGKGEMTVQDTATHTLTQNLRIGGQNFDYAARLGSGKYTVVGSTVTVNVTRNFQVNTPASVLKFVADAAGFSTINQTGANYGFRPGGTLEIDTTAYVGGPKSWDLVTWAGTLDETTNITLAAFIATATLPGGWSLTTDTTAGAGKITLVYAPTPQAGGPITANVTSPVTEGSQVILTAPAGSNYLWSKDGVEIPGETGATLVIDPATTADSGSYTVQYRDVEWRISDAFALTVSPVEIVPVAGALGLLALAGACGLGGAWMIRRRK